MCLDGRIARDVILGLMKTCRKPGIWYYRYLGDHFGLPPTLPIPPLAELVGV